MRRAVASAIAALFSISILGTAVPETAPVAAAVPGTVTVDELSAGFTPTGSGWRSDTFGYGGHHYWARTSGRARLTGIWRAELAPGTYRVQARIPARHASTRRAVYRLRTADGWTTRVRDQRKNRARWMGLGTHTFSAQAEVRLRDRTRDPRGVRRSLAFDAVRFIPVLAPDPTPTPVPTAPVIQDIIVKPEDTRAIVTFSLDAKGPAKTEYRRAGTNEWLVGADETSSTYADHRQVVTGLAPETTYEVRVSASNAKGTTTSDIVPFTTKPRTVDCDEGEDLQDAIDRAGTGETIIVLGMCRGNYTVGSPGGFKLRGRDGATIRGDGTGTLVSIQEGVGALTIVGLTLKDGGEGIAAPSFSDMTLRDVVITGNDTGIALGGNLSTAAIHDSVLSGNGTAVSGGGQGGPSVYRSTIRNNTTGLRVFDALIEDSVIENNGPGGGIRVSHFLTVRRSRILDNRFDKGGGISYLGAPGGSATIEESLFRGNRATTQGGGMWAASDPSGSVTLRDVRFENNTAGEDGGGLYVEGAPPTLTNVTFTDNTPNGCVGC